VLSVVDALVVGDVLMKTTAASAFALIKSICTPLIVNVAFPSATRLSRETTAEELSWLFVPEASKNTSSVSCAVKNRLCRLLPAP
jgi:hypothetical protein